MKNLIIWTLLLQHRFHQKWLCAVWEPCQGATQASTVRQVMWESNHVCLPPWATTSAPTRTFTYFRMYSRLRLLTCTLCSKKCILGRQTVILERYNPPASCTGEQTSALCCLTCPTVVSQWNEMSPKLRIFNPNNREYNLNQMHRLSLKTRICSVSASKPTKSCFRREEPTPACVS